MGIKLIAGRSGSGKSTYIYEQVIKAATENPKQSYFVVVPDQFTMQTQMDMVRLSPNKGIMNIEVLSFSRLAHRVFEETGGHRRPVLDDTGKNLILRRCATDIKDDIPYLAGKLNKTGYIHEIKSAISEFMQYGIDNDRLHELIAYADSGNRNTLKKKLNDLSVIYEHFKEYIRDNYLTTEESISALAKDIYKCQLIKDSTVIFDGFTGFTPVQNSVLHALADVCQNVIFTLTVDPDTLATESVNDNDVFSFSRKTYDYILRMAREHMEVVDIISMHPGIRYSGSRELSFLEGHFLRHDKAVYGNECYDIRLNSYKDLRDDVRGLAKNIRELVRTKNICFRDMAVITGNLEAYSGEIEDIFEEYDIPYYMDRNKGIVLNPFVEFIKSALDICITDFKYESVFRYLRTGFSTVKRDDADKLDDYVIATGIRGIGAYSSVFIRKCERIECEKADVIRTELMNSLSALTKAGITPYCKLKASEYVKALYDLIKDNDCISKLSFYSDMFEEKGDYSRSMEYSQIYRKTMQLFEQINDLVGEEKMEAAEFLRLLDAGFSEIKLGSIPQSVDRVIIGDMERTRLKPVKYLFFIGMNDGWVPKSTAKGGIISDGDREFLSGCDVELSPSPRNRMYIDRFYLYLNLTKPSEGLYLSYVGMDSQYKALRPSYVVEHIKRMFPSLRDEFITFGSMENIESLSEAKDKFVTDMRLYADGLIKKDAVNDLGVLYSLLCDEDDYAHRIIDNAFSRYKNRTLNERMAAILYGSDMYMSISRLETYAKCAYAYFLKYGLGLKEREVYGIDASDMGNIYHGVLEIFINLLSDRGLNWSSFDEETAKELVDEAVEKMATLYTDARLFENEKNKYIVTRMKSVMLRTVKTIAYQLKSGSFAPYAYEYRFDREISDNDASIRINGKIDRVDMCENSDEILVKIVDYKSGSKDFSFMCFYTGVQLQMVVYMNRMIEELKNKYPDKKIKPAAMLYYHIDDPLMESGENESDEAIEKKILKELRGKGIIIGNEEILNSLDNSGNADSDVITVKRGKDGKLSGSGIVDEDELDLIGRYADKKLKNLVHRIVTGDIDTDPVMIYKGDSNKELDSCEYCEYKSVCGFDVKTPGCVKTVYREQGSSGRGSGKAISEIIADMKVETDGTVKENEQDEA